mmetsp:Transcript_54074/g.73889  ORF Transcript_54074/g.73889 Transcript_54074/m.73889 type:complete len:429 (-) Transcript_54074:262-1548(-)
MMVMQTTLHKGVKSLKVSALANPCYAMSTWLADVPMGPPDSLFGLIDAYNKDPAEKKISLSIGAYRDDEGLPYVLPSVRMAETRIVSSLQNKEYAGISGLDSFVDEALKFAYGEDSSVLTEERVAGVQTISGTGALRIGAEMVSRFVGEGTPIYLPAPTWANHIPIMRDGGLEVKHYNYYDQETCGLNLAGMLDDIRAAPKKSVFLLHACAHNPTGVDPTPDQWRAISDACKEMDHFVFFDFAYQGFASGDAVCDAFALRHFIDEGHLVLMSQSFSKNFGLYGERAGALSAVCADKEERDRVQSQMKILIRPMYSNPPIHGARLVSTILKDAQLRSQWEKDCLGMASRITSMRASLVESLKSQGSKKSWGHVTDQIGMFCYSGLSPDEVEAAKNEHSVYMTKDGRISMAGVTSENVEYLAYAMHEVTK